jgi:hypothetical protein
MVQGYFRFWWLGGSFPPNFEGLFVWGGGIPPDPVVTLLISDLECHNDLECQNFHFKILNYSNNSIQFHPGYLPDGKARHLGGNAPTQNLALHIWVGIINFLWWN